MAGSDNTGPQGRGAGRGRRMGRCADNEENPKESGNSQPAGEGTGSQDNEDGKGMGRRGRGRSGRGQGQGMRRRNRFGGGA
jgi:hypothetical protein